MFLVMEPKGKSRFQGESGQQYPRGCGPGLVCVDKGQKWGGAGSGSAGRALPVKTISW